MMEVVEDRIRRELTALEDQRQGALMITVGKVLLWMDLVLACFIYVGLRAGSYLFLWWVLGQAVLGVVLIAIGTRKKSAAHRRFVELTGDRQ